MPCGKRVWLGTRRPFLSREVSAQQSSRLTYWYPAALRPLDTKMSAIALTIPSLNPEPHLVEFQLLNPIGGVRASPLASGLAGGAARSTPPVIPPTARPGAASTAVR